MDTTDPEITFDSNGYCNHCTDFLEHTSKLMYPGETGDKVREQLIQKIKKAGKNSPYDCLMSISGGTDSCYAAYMCKQAGLRTLLFHMDNGWNSPTSVTNIKLMADKLGFDYTSYVLDWEEFKDLQLSFFKASVPELETPTDIAIIGCLHKIAAQHNIKHIIMGGNYATEGILPKSWHYDAKDKKYLNAIQNKFGAKKLKTFPAFDFLQEVYYKLLKGIRIIYLLNHVPYNKQIATRALEELGWKPYGEKHHESFYTRVLQSYILPVKFNIDYRKATISIRICAGRISREEGMQLLSEKLYDATKIKDDIEYVSKKLGITVDEFHAIMNRPPKTYNDYPNSRKKLELIYKTYRYFSPIPKERNGAPSPKEKKISHSPLISFDKNQYPAVFRKSERSTFFSVIIPAYNRASFLPDTINSILQQTFNDYEIIIIDDGSTDNTKEVLKPYFEKHSHIKYFWQENRERSAARNFGIQQASGDYMVIFDSDDLMLPDYLDTLYHKIQALRQPDFIAVKHALKRDGKFYSSTLSLLKEGWYDINLLLHGNPFACHFCIKKKNASLKLFEERREYATMEDWMFLIQNIPGKKIFVIDKVAVVMNEHPNQSMQRDHRKVISARLLAIEWIIQKNILNTKQKKKIQGYSFFFCAIHSYLDNNRKMAFHYLFRSIKYKIPAYKIFMLFIKIAAGKKNAHRLKLLLNNFYDHELLIHEQERRKISAMHPVQDG